MSVLTKPMLFLPLAVSIAALIVSDSAIIYILFPVSVFIAAAVIPEFKRWETLSVCFMITIYGIPANIGLMQKLHEIFTIGNTAVSGLIYSVVFFFVLVSIENIVFGVIAGRIWRSQYNLSAYLEKLFIQNPSGDDP